MLTEGIKEYTQQRGVVPAGVSKEGSLCLATACMTSEAVA